MDGRDLIFNGEIVLDGNIVPHEFVQWFDGAAFSARMVREALAEFSGDVVIRVNSMGGSPFEGEAIRSAIAGFAGNVTCVVEGSAMSAASLLIMAADQILMSLGSTLMIHDPSMCTCGDEADHLQSAAELAVLGNGYAEVYAARSGQSVDEARAMMRAETYFTANDAIAAGFADGLAGDATVDPVDGDGSADVDPQTNAQADTDAAAMFAQAHARFGVAYQMAMRDCGAVSRTTNNSVTVSAGHQPAMSANQEEAVMPEENTPAATPVTLTPPVDREAILMQERERVRVIRAAAEPFMSQGVLSAAQVNTVIDEGVTAEGAAVRLMAVMAASDAVTSSGGAAVILRDEQETRAEGMIQALMRNYDGPGADYRGLRMRGLALQMSGNLQSYGDVERIQHGMRSTSMMGGAHGVSDFAYITTEVMRRTLIAEYERRGSQWDLVAGTPLSAADFRELHAVRFGGDFTLKPVGENGEYQEATLDDEAEGLKVERRGRRINITFEAVVNDDMGAFTRIPRDFAMAARVMENGMVWALIRDNAKTKSDNKALFHADHGNLAGSSGAISVATVGAGRKAMWEQRAFGSKDKEDFLNINPDRLIVPAALETVAMQFVAGVTPAKDADTNPFKGTLTSHTVPNLGASAGGSDASWYLVSSDMPPISVARLDGYDAPSVTTLEGMSPDKVSMEARHIFGAAPTEYRGAYKNP